MKTYTTKQLKRALSMLRNTALSAIEDVGMANYQDRVSSALARVERRYNQIVRLLTKRQP